MMLRATAYRLHRRPHVTVARGEIPTCRQELISRNPSAVVHLLGRTSHQIGEHLRPNDISVTFDHDVGATQFSGFFRIQGCVNAAIYDPGSALTRHASHLHASQSIAGVDADAHYVTGLYAFGLNLFERLVSDERIAVPGGSCSGKYVQPTRRDHADSERSITGID